MSRNIVERDLRHRVYSTENMSVLQCDKSEQFIIRFYNDEILLKPCAFIAFRKKVKDLDPAALLAGDSPDIEIISLPTCARILPLGIYEVLEIKDLMDGAIAMLELNSILHKEVHRKAILN